MKEAVIHRTARRGLSLALVLLLLAPAGCRDQGKDRATPAEPLDSQGAARDGVISVSAAVRQNLGITFAKAERRAVDRTRRFPGKFELLPEARREYRAAVDGKVEILVRELQRVDPGTPLYRIDSAAWRTLQKELAATEASIAKSLARLGQIESRLEAHEKHEAALRASNEFRRQRVADLERLQAAGGGRADDLAAARASQLQGEIDLSEIIERDAELLNDQVEARTNLQTGQSQRDLLLSDAAALTGLSKDTLAAATDEARDGICLCLWRRIDTLEVQASTSGIVDRIVATNGGWVESSNLVVAVMQPQLLRFRARGLQADLGTLRSGLPARIVPPPGGSLARVAPIDCDLEIGVEADADQRSIDLLAYPRSSADWPRAGVVAWLEVTEDGGSEAALAIPLAAVIADGLERVFFRRDPRHPDSAIRVVADLGVDDGRWVVVKSGLMLGDEVVLDGVYPLMLSTSGTAAKGGHFHADGTFHAGGDEK